MSHTLLGPQPMEFSLPVILPLPSGDVGIERRFAFPELRGPPADSAVGGDGPRVVWPECERPETARACAEVAQAIRWRLSAERPAALAITSPAAGDGKTSLVVALAPELARRTPGGVLVVDADYCGSGLTTRLAWAGSGMPAGSAFVWPTSVAGLSVLPMPPRPQSRGVDPRWHNPAWIAELRERWPLVLVECASLEHAETALILKHCDGVCVVVRLGHTARRAVVEAGRAIRAGGGRLLGCVAVG